MIIFVDHVFNLFNDIPNGGSSLLDDTKYIDNKNNLSTF